MPDVQCTQLCTLHFRHLLPGKKMCTLYFITYPDVVYKVTTAAIIIQTRGVQSVFSLEKDLFFAFWPAFNSFEPRTFPTVQQRFIFQLVNGNVENTMCHVFLYYYFVIEAPKFKNYFFWGVFLWFFSNLQISMVFELAIYGKKQLSFQLCYLRIENIGRHS